MTKWNLTRNQMKVNYNIHNKIRDEYSSKLKKLQEEEKEIKHKSMDSQHQCLEWSILLSKEIEDRTIHMGFIRKELLDLKTNIVIPDEKGKIDYLIDMIEIVKNEMNEWYDTIISDLKHEKEKNEDEKYDPYKIKEELQKQWKDAYKASDET